MSGSDAPRRGAVRAFATVVFAGVAFAAVLAFAFATILPFAFAATLLFATAFALAGADAFAFTADGLALPLPFSARASVSSIS